MKTVTILRVALACAASAALSQLSACSATMPHNSAEVVGANGVRFGDVDRNSDGKLTQAETQALLATYNFERQDTNDDGLLSKPEFGRNGAPPP